MSIYVLGAIIIFGVFVIILIVNPNLSCFGKRIKSPFYPLIRKRKKKSSKEKKIDDYGFSLVDEESRKRQRITSIEPRERRKKLKKEPKIDDYGFSLSDDKKKREPEEEKGEKK
ncbi:MAG: hypothetical protein R6V00_05285 [Candidatus Aminicenantes bacterium]